MSEQKVVVPDGMHIAACSGQMGGNYPLNERFVNEVRRGLEAALRWLDEELAGMQRTGDAGDFSRGYREGIKDVRRMWDVPEPEGRDALDKLLEDVDPDCRAYGMAMEAYRIGRQSKERK